MENAGHWNHVCVLNCRTSQYILSMGEIIGKTGSTGNASAMTTIPKGAHLHFEARSAPLLGVGLTGRMDPIPFMNANLPY